MTHPSSRSARRFVRQTHIQKRVFKIKCRSNTPGMLAQPGRYSKWNLGCDCLMCHADKYFTAKRRRRRALTQDIIRNIREWQE
jgi:hypothetical protein